MPKRLIYPCYFLESRTQNRFIGKDTAVGTAVLLFTSERLARTYKQASQLNHRIESISGEVDLLAFLDSLPSIVTHALIDIDPNPNRQDEQVIRLSDLESILLVRVLSRL
jgi:hypothetical protein